MSSNRKIKLSQIKVAVKKTGPGESINISLINLDPAQYSWKELPSLLFNEGYFCVDELKKKDTGEYFICITRYTCETSPSLQ